MLHPPSSPQRTDIRRIGIRCSYNSKKKEVHSTTHGGLTESMVCPGGIGSVFRTTLGLVPRLLAPHLDADAVSREAAARAESEALQLSMVARERLFHAMFSLL